VRVPPDLISQGLAGPFARTTRIGEPRSRA